MDIYSSVSKKLCERGITLFAPVSLQSCTVTKKYLLEKHGIADGTVIMLAVPYLSPCLVGEHNISAYCAVRDYHGFFELLKSEIIPELSNEFPHNSFALFSDHSPIDERDTAARAGLGIIGKNGMLITERYSSYVFLGELITDAKLDCCEHQIRYCENCGLCQKSCPAPSIGECLSATTQKKQALTASEKATMQIHNTVWGCDICQRVCPHTKKAIASGTIFTEIEYFLHDIIPDLSSDILNSLNDDSFSKRAFSWRGRDVVKRNLEILEKGHKD